MPSVPHHLLCFTLGINLTKKAEGKLNEVDQDNMFRLLFLLRFLFITLLSFNKRALGICGARHCPELLREDGKQKRLLEITCQASRTKAQSRVGEGARTASRSQAGGLSLLMLPGPQTLAYHHRRLLFLFIIFNGQA